MVWSDKGCLGWGMKVCVGRQQDWSGTGAWRWIFPHGAMWDGKDEDAQTGAVLLWTFGLGGLQELQGRKDLPWLEWVPAKVR